MPRQEGLIPKGLLARFVRKPEKQTQRSLIEGTWHDEWNRLHLFRWESDQIVPSEVTTLAKVGNLYDMALVARISDNGEVVPVEFSEVESGTTIEFDQGFTFANVERARTVILEDGRVYHDLNLRDQKILEALLDALKEEFPQQNPVRARLSPGT